MLSPPKKVQLCYLKCFFLSIFFCQMIRTSGRSDNINFFSFLFLFFLSPKADLLSVSTGMKLECVPVPVESAVRPSQP